MCLSASKATFKNLVALHGCAGQLEALLAEHNITGFRTKWFMASLKNIYPKQLGNMDNSS